MRVGSVRDPHRALEVAGGLLTTLSAGGAIGKWATLAAKEPLWTPFFKVLIVFTAVGVLMFLVGILGLWPKPAQASVASGKTLANRLRTPRPQTRLDPEQQALAKLASDLIASKRAKGPPPPSLPAERRDEKQGVQNPMRSVVKGDHIELSIATGSPPTGAPYADCYVTPPSSETTYHARRGAQAVGSGPLVAAQVRGPRHVFLRYPFDFLHAPLVLEAGDYQIRWEVPNWLGIGLKENQNFTGTVRIFERQIV